MSWQLLAVLVPFTFVIYQTLSKQFPKDFPLYLANAYAFFIGFLFMLLMHFLLTPQKSLALNSKYLPIIFSIGILLSLGNFGVIKIFSLGAPQSQFSVIFYTTLIIYGVIFGLVIWHEQLQLLQIVGILFALAGIFMTVYFKK
jgi:drug/metabolite transporter (DMT)-like permease